MSVEIHENEGLNSKTDKHIHSLRNEKERRKADLSVSDSQLLKALSENQKAKFQLLTFQLPIFSSAQVHTTRDLLLIPLFRSTGLALYIGFWKDRCFVVNNVLFDLRRGFPCEVQWSDSTGGY
ncbi:hypothetical protein K2173_022659 [Erythroxylum novogranatense]|uniref:Uncharacterized protein n=1 Tax=Erythroxylum novogranatense TaxID=1862640 RepID=A0AAV8TNN8_9ROSI|nr:hypothetical protein K2173_022659 [Erythroxylum novogranatense]